MQLIRRPGRGRQCLPTGSAVTVGTFDGVHLGHRSIISRVRDRAQSLGVPSVVFSFEPTPAEFFRRDDPPPRLTRFREKFAALTACGVDGFFCPPFNADMEKLTPSEFIDELLIGVLGARHVVIGDDFRFAHRRAGRFEDLQSAGERQGFTVERVESVLENGQRVSSTEIRRALGEGDLDRARQLLGRWYRISGRVVPGRQLGRELGYPTANVRLARHTVALTGIFAVRVAGLGDMTRDGVASLGYRPTIAGGDTEPLLEVHLFDFDEDIYGRLIDVDFVAHIRPEEAFADLAALTRQMHDDADRARTILAQPDPFADLT
jgi:riboflavin kinase/FMN adenylyltransferase